MSSIKSTASQFGCVWLLIVVMVFFTLCHTVSGCNNAKIYDAVGYGKIKICDDPAYCEIKLIVRDKQCVDDCGYFKISFCHFYLDCESEYIEILDLERRQPITDRFCGNMKTKSFMMKKEKSLLIRYKLTTKMRAERHGRCLYYSRYHHDYEETRPPPKQSPYPGIITIAIGITLGMIILIGALVCGHWLVHHVKPRRTRTTRRRPVSITPAQLPSTDITKHPRLPNYYDNEGAVPPPYLETIDTDGNPVYPPSYYEIDPPPYSILDAEGSLETRGDTRATDRMNMNL